MEIAALRVVVVAVVVGNFEESVRSVARLEPN